MLPPSHLLADAPDELTSGRLTRLGEGIGKVVYASEHWVVKRERSPREIVALIVLWKLLRRIERLLPGGVKLTNRPSLQIRLLRVMVQTLMPLVPRGLWLTTHVREAWRIYRKRDLQGEHLASVHLAGTDLIPARVSFPPARVRIGGWPGWLIAGEATERVEMTLHGKLIALARAGDYEAMKQWLDRFLALRQNGWQRGLFSVDAHLKNFGVIGSRIVLLDSGGLTDSWDEIERRLDMEEATGQPHIRLGLGPWLQGRPDVAESFDQRWRQIVNRDVVRELWPK